MSVAIVAQAQTDRQLLRNGNKLFKARKFAQAETEYRKAIGKNSQNARAVYNLGCALMSQGNDSAAALQFQQAAMMSPSKMQKSQAYYNEGVAYHKVQNFGAAIKAYKNALRNNPKDEDARYNLALCKRQQQQQQQNQQNQKDKHDQNKDQDKDKQDKDKQQKKDKQDDKNQQQQQDKDQMSKEDAEQMLNAALQAEKATQQKLKKAMAQPSRRNLEKNW